MPALLELEKQGCRSFGVMRCIIKLGLRPKRSCHSAMQVQMSSSSAFLSRTPWCLDQTCFAAEPPEVLWASQLCLIGGASSSEGPFSESTPRHVVRVARHCKALRSGNTLVTIARYSGFHSNQSQSPSTTKTVIFEGSTQFPHYRALCLEPTQNDGFGS